MFERTINPASKDAASEMKNLTLFPKQRTISMTPFLRLLPKRAFSTLIPKTALFSLLLIGGLVLFARCDSTEPEFPTSPRSGFIQVSNSRFDTYDLMFYRRSGEVNWSKNYFDEGTFLGPNEIVTYYMPVGTFDFLFEGSDEDAYYFHEKVEIAEGQTTSIELQ